MATASPTCRALSAGSSRCGPMKTAPPPGAASFMSNLVFGSGSCGMGLRLSAAQSAPVNTPSTPGIALRLRRIDRDDARVRIRRAHHRRIGLAVETEIVGETALAGNEPRILLARHRLADEAVAGLVRPCFVVHRSSPGLRNAPGNLLRHAHYPNSAAAGAAVNRPHRRRALRMRQSATRAGNHRSVSLNSMRRLRR